MLEGIECRLQSLMSELADVPRNLTIEVLMPVNWEANHSAASRTVSTSQSGRDPRHRLVLTVGNLTFMNQKLNSQHVQRRTGKRKAGTDFWNTAF